MRASLCTLLIAAVIMSGCASTSENDPATLIPDKQLNISKHFAPTLESIAAAIVIYYIIDPLAPNWKIQQAQIGNDTYRIQMLKKRFTTGGDGEAPQIFYRRAEQLTRETGGVTYRIVAFTEGVESNVLIAQRVAQGVIEVVR